MHKFKNSFKGYNENVATQSQYNGRRRDSQKFLGTQVSNE